MTEGLKTVHQKTMEARHKKVCEMYKDFAESNELASPHRIFGAIAEKVGMTSNGVRNIIVANGLYTPKAAQ